MATGQIILGSLPASLLMTQAYFNFNKVFKGVWVYFLKSETGSGIVTLCKTREN